MWGKRTSIGFLTAAALLAAGCGSSSPSSGSGSKGSASAGAGGNAIARAAYVSTSSSGYKIAMTLSETVPQLGGSIHGTGTGSFNVPKHSGQMSIDMSLPGAASAIGNLDIHEIVLGQNIFLELPSLIASRLPGGKPWVEVNLSSLGKDAGVSGLSSLTGGPGSTDPGQFLQYLRATSSGITNLGSATVNGISTTHYRGTIELSKVSSALPASQRSTASQAIASLEKLTGLKTMPVDVYVDSANLVRRLDLSYNVTTAGQSVSSQIQIDFTAYGPQPVPSPPPSGEVGSLSSLLSGLGGLGTSTSSSG
jgi:hypothetical protein